jgi:hypothetical protein
MLTGENADSRQLKHHSALTGHDVFNRSRYKQFSICFDGVLDCQNKSSMFKVIPLWENGNCRMINDLGDGQGIIAWRVMTWTGHQCLLWQIQDRSSEAWGDNYIVQAFSKEQSSSL